MSQKSNIVLIGMPGSGKSTIGVLLAKQMMRDFVDTDVLVQMKHGRSLQDIVDRDGYLTLRSMEEQILLDLHCRDHIIATGGSAVYSEAAMEHLGAEGVIVFLQVALETLKARVRDYETRGLSRRPGQTIEDLFAERSALYGKYADITIACAGLGHREICSKIIDAVRSFP